MRGRGGQHEHGPTKPTREAEPLPTNERRLDAQLFALSRENAALRLRLGQALEVLQRVGHCFALGFSSCWAYALERCDRSTRWVDAARCLARRLEGLPALRRARAGGELTWSAAEIVSRVARRSDEAEGLEVARRHTVRGLGQFVCASEQNSGARTAGGGEGGNSFAALRTVACDGERCLDGRRRAGGRHRGEERRRVR